MKKKINLIRVFIVASIATLICTACTGIDKERVAPDNSKNAIHSTDVSVSTQPTENATEATTEDNENAEKKIVLDVYTHFWRPIEADDELSEHDYAIMNKVDNLTNRYLGSITSERDAVEKGKIALEELYQSAENYFSYEAKFYDEYDVWVVKATVLPSYIDEEGMGHATFGTAPYIVIRESDGKALGTFVR